MIGMALQFVAEMIRTKGKNVAEALLGFAAQFAGPTLGPILGGISAIIGALRQKRQRQFVATAPGDALTVRFPQSTSYFPGANPASAQLAGRTLFTGAGAQQVHVHNHVTYGPGGIEQVAKVVSGPLAEIINRQSAYGWGT